MDLHSISVDLPPPTYNAVRTQSTDFSKYLRTIAGINTPSIPCAVVCTAFDLIFTLISLVVGTTNMSACPVEPRIPIYLVVCATINLTSILFTIIGFVLHLKGKDEHIFGFFYVTAASIMIIILQIVNFIWLIIGTVWVFSAFNEVRYDEINSKNYCQRNLYQYTLASIILQYIIPLAICCCKNIPLLKN